MNRSNDRLLVAWSLGTGAVISLLSLLSLVLEWSWGVQLALTVLMGIAVTGMQIGTKRVQRRR
jgi:hypothetical protein